MKPVDLTPRELELIRGVLERHPEVKGALLFGSRAKGTSKPSSDVDLALEDISDPLKAQLIASELEELPLPYRFDVVALRAIRSASLEEHIARVGVRIFGEDSYGAIDLGPRTVPPEVSASKVTPRRKNS